MEEFLPRKRRNPKAHLFGCLCFLPPHSYVVSLTDINWKKEDEGVRPKRNGSLYFQHNTTRANQASVNVPVFFFGKLLHGEHFALCIKAEKAV
jgi:hypothetical protein